MARERRHRSRPRRRRGRFSGLYKLISVLLIAAALGAAALVFFRVNIITVAGNSRYTEQEIVEASGIKPGDNLIALSRSRIAAGIRVSLPYVRSVAIEQLPPETVRITVEEHPVAAAVQDEGGVWWYLAANGKVLEKVIAPGGVMVVEGLTAVEPKAGEWLAVSEEQEGRREYVFSLLDGLEKAGVLDDCAQIDCSAPGVLALRYLNFQVRVPTTYDFEYMISFLDAAFESGRVDRGGTGTFDFTVGDGTAVYSAG